MIRKICKKATVWLLAGVISLSAVTVQAAEVDNGASYPITTNAIEGWPQGPDTYSETAVLMDADTGAVLYDKGMDDYRYPASITKIMTILVSMEHSSPKDVVTFTETGIRDVNWDSTNIGAQLGETMTMRDCWYAAYIKSANEVCAQIAEYVGGTEADFVNMMNQKAQELGCTNTHFANAGGLPDPDHYTTAHDMAKILQAGLKSKRFRRVFSSTGHTIPATNLSAERAMHTHMPLMAKESDLYYEGCIGGKTGFTNDAGHTLVVAAERNGRTYIAVTMRTTDLGINCTDSRALFDYAFNSFDSLEINGTTLTVPKGVTVNDLQKESADVNGTTMDSYSYNGQFVGYTPVVQETPVPTETPVPESTADHSEKAATDSSTEVSSSEQSSVTSRKGLSQTAKILLGVMGGMVLVLIILLVALHKKENR